MTVDMGRPEPLELAAGDTVHHDEHGDGRVLRVRNPSEPFGAAEIDFGNSVVRGIALRASKLHKVDAVDELHPEAGLPQGSTVELRRIRLTPASSIRPRPVRWTWDLRLPVGEVALTPGRGGIGKSTFHAWALAHLTLGTLPGTHYGQPRPGFIAATEDSWSRTIVPRLIAAGADLDLVYRVDVVTETDGEVSISLPRDMAQLEAEIERLGAVLLSVDPLLGVVSGVLDTHKDADVRQALTPLARLADRTGCTVVGNAHFNKSSGSDPMSLVMGSAAFGNVARAALGFARDTEAEDGSCVISQVKNNLGRVDLPSLRYTIEESFIDTEEGPASVGKLVMLGESDRSVADILRDRADDGEKSERDEAAEWLTGYLEDQGGSALAKDLFKAARADGIGERRLQRARAAAGVDAKRQGFGQGSVWTIRDTIRDVHDRRRGPVGNGANGVANGDPRSTVPPPGACRHGVEHGDQPDDFLNGKIRCVQCRADATTDTLTFTGGPS